ncbi:hypothetical protein ACKUFS_16315 [Pseudomonas cannabina]|uniref:hypothetical protein n=1 Tax=Pseudomonas syringae group TaxID=136849 RepID=UPI0006B9EDE5|nr:MULTISPECIES: hypothetical protein [Pseudomonas syringae group]QQN20992.1 hypothetical protein JGS08_20655 [Pseudomonas cannabina pv. alisalensis]
MNQHLSLSNIPTAPVLMAALAVMSGYGDAVSEKQTAAREVGYQHEASQQVDQLASSIHKLIKDLKIMEDSFGVVIKAMLCENPVRMPKHMSMAESLDELGSTLESIRGMECALRDAVVPEVLADLHMNLRRGMARAREKVSIARSIIFQMTPRVAALDTKVNFDGLRDLADHSTKRLIQLAKA